MGSHWEDQAERYALIRGPFLDIPIDERDTPYSRLYDTHVPPVVLPKKFTPKRPGE